MEFTSRGGEDQEDSCGMRFWLHQLQSLCKFYAVQIWYLFEYFRWQARRACSYAPWLWCAGEHKVLVDSEFVGHEVGQQWLCELFARKELGRDRKCLLVYQRHSQGRRFWTFVAIAWTEPAAKAAKSSAKAPKSWSQKKRCPPRSMASVLG